MIGGQGRAWWRFALVVAWTSALYTLYQLTNRCHLIAPVTLPLTPLDRAFPFWTWTVIPYFGLIAGMYLPGFLHDGRLFMRTMLALTIAVLINDTIFALWPTTYPRPPLPTGTAFYDGWYRWLTTIDTPANCFPSGHITAPAIGCWALAREHPRQRWLIRIAIVPFALTILTTKQHYAWDLVGGLATAGIGIILTWRMGESRPAGVPSAGEPVGTYGRNR